MKRKLIIMAVLASSLLMTTCTKEDPKPCPEPPELCEATPFTEGFKTNIVGKWRFFKIAWYNQLGVLQGYKDTNELAVSYMMEVHSNGTVDYYRNDTLYETRKIKVFHEVEGNPPVEPLGVVVGDMDCIAENPEENSFSVVLLDQDTLRVSYRPLVIRNEATGEHSGKGRYYRMP